MAKRVKKPTTKKRMVKKPKRKVIKKTIKKASKKKKPTTKVSKKKKPKKKPKIKSTRVIILERFSKKGKIPPVRYRRPVPKGMSKVLLKIGNSKLKTGYIIEFKYGYKQKQGQVGGWKNDPRPVIIVFYDDKVKYVEGINTNYLSDYYVKKIKAIMKRFPGIEGEELYEIFKRTAKFAIKKGYRKYMRDSFRDIYRYVYKDELVQELDDQAKSKQSDMSAN